MKHIKPFYVVLLIAIAILLFSGCSNKTEIKYVDRPFEQIVVVKCKVPEVTECVYGKTTYTGEINQMRMCIRQMQEAIEVCK